MLSIFDHKNILLLLVFIFSFLLNVNTSEHGFVLDDILLITENPLVMSKEVDVFKIFTEPNLMTNYHNKVSYRPFPVSYAAALYSYFDGDSKPMHWLHVFFYSLSCVLLLLLLYKINPPGIPNYVLFFTCLLFAAHPLQSEVSANLKSIDEIFSLIGGLSFCIASLNFYESKKPRWLIFAAIALWFGVFSKLNAVTFIIIPIVIVYFKNNFKRSDLSFTSKTIFSGILSVFFYYGIKYYLRTYIVGKTGISKPKLFNTPLNSETPFLDYYATVFETFFIYFQNFFFPFKLTYFYGPPFIEVRSFDNLYSMIGLLIFIAFIFLLFYGLSKRKWSTLGLICFAINFSIYSNLIVRAPDIMADRYLFASLWGLSFYIIIGTYEWFVKNRWSIKLWTTFIAMLLLYFSIISFERNKDWESNRILFANDYKINSESAFLNGQMAILNIIDYQKDKDSVVLDTIGEMVKKAEKVYFDPRFLGYYIFKARKAFEENRFNNSLEIANDGLENATNTTYVDPNYIDYKNELLVSKAKALAELDNWKEAGLALEDVNSRYARNEYYHFMFYYELTINQDTLETLKVLNEGVSKFPNDGFINRELAKIYLMKEEYQKAASHFKQTLKIIPDDEETLYYLSKLRLPK